MTDTSPTLDQLPNIVQQLEEMTAPLAEELWALKAVRVNSIDTEARILWERMMQIIHTNPLAYRKFTLHVMPALGPRLFGETAIACRALHVEEKAYWSGCMASLRGAPVNVPPDENLRHTIVGIKGVHAQASVIREHLQMLMH